MKSADRVPCVVPHCRCTRAHDPAWRDYICPKHFRLVDKRLRRLRGKIKRKGVRLGWPSWLERMEQRTWDQAVQQAIERAAGI